MKSPQMELLHLLFQKEEKKSYAEWTVTGITQEMIVELQSQGLIVISSNQGFVGALRTLSLTGEGKEFIKDYCDVCECMPCDCDWGQP